MRNKIDLTGKKFGDWTIVKPIKRILGEKGKLKWLCKCKCGNEKFLGSHHIRNNWNPTNCGCTKTLVGKRFGRLLITERLGKDARHVSNYKCKCDCGNERTYRGSHLIYRKVVSCGCARKNNIDVNGAKIVWFDYKRHSKKRGLEFSLSKDDLLKIIKMPCYYCGDENTNKTWPYKKITNDNQIFRHNGIDRVNNEKGYTLVNCVPCCKNCNHMKWNLTRDQWIDHMKKIIKYQQKTAIGE